MSFLKNSCLPLLLLGGCGDDRSSAKILDGMGYEQKITYAKKLPVRQRLDLFEQRAKESGHNPDLDISVAFAGDASATWNEIVYRIRSDRGSRHYLTLLAIIDQGTNFRICEQSDRKIVQSFLKKQYLSDPNLDAITFLNC